MGEVLDSFFGLLVGAVALVGFGFWGMSSERRHLRDLAEREKKYLGIVVLDTPTVPAGITAVRGELVTGSVVQASDLLKTWLMGWRALFGGEMVSIGRVLTRARREALLRLKEDANRLGATVVVNVRFETSTLGQARGRRGLPTSEIVAYGTALLPR